MIALRSDDCDLGVFERILDHVSDICCGRYNFFKVIIPDSVWGVIAGPDQNIRLDYLGDVFEHCFKSFRRCVTLVRAPPTCLALLLCWKALVGTTA